MRRSTTRPQERIDLDHYGRAIRILRDVLVSL